MKNLKKTIALLLTALLIFSLSACQSSASTDSDNTTAKAEQSESVSTEDGSETTDSNVPGDFPGEPPKGGPGGTPPDGNGGPGGTPPDGNGGFGGGPGGNSSSDIDYTGDVEISSIDNQSGQTYSRKVDYQVLQALAGIAQSAAKFSNDIRLLSHLKVVDEPFESGQIGSSAMAYKRNPMRSERIASLSRYVICDLQNAAMTASTQWFERTLDDSANRRICIPEAFLALDGVLNLYLNIVSGMTVYPKMAEKLLNDELPFMATENILMYCVKEKGGDRQVLHEAIRRHSVTAAKEVKQNGRSNDLFERILNDPVFDLTEEELKAVRDPIRFTGMAVQQTEAFLQQQAAPILAQYADDLGLKGIVTV